MLHRTFIAINLPKEVKNKTLELKNEYNHIPAKWVERENVHITLSFLGNLDDNQLIETINIAESVIQNYEPFVLNVKEMGLGPKIPPRLIWLTLDENKILSRLNQELEDNIYSLDSYKFKTKEQRKFIPHITLARIKSFEAKRLNKDSFDIKHELDINFEVNSIEIMESELKKTGPEYIILRSILL